MIDLPPPPKFSVKCRQSRLWGDTDIWNFNPNFRVHLLFTGQLISRLHLSRATAHMSLPNDRFS